MAKMLNIYENPILRQYAVVIVVNLSILATGMGLVWTSPVLVKLGNSSESVLPAPVTDEEGSWIVSIGYLASILANFQGAYLLDKIGRKGSAIAAAVPKLVSGFLLIFANNVWMILVARCLIGISDGLILIVVPVYASEIASKDLRGSLGTILQVLASLGVVIMLSMGPFLSYLNLNIIYTCVIIGTAIPLLFIPESPYFLYSKGQTEKSQKVLVFLRGSEILANEEMKQYATGNHNERVKKRELFKNKVFLKAFGLVLGIGIIAQMSGFNVVSFYLQTILESTQSSFKSEIASVVIGCIQMFASICTIFLSDRVGRKPILIITLLGMSLGMFGLGTFFKIQSIAPITGFLNYLPLVSLILVVFCYSAGLGSLMWALMAELFDDRARGVGMSLSSMSMYCFLFLTTKYFTIVTKAIGPSITYWFFSSMCIISSLFIVFCIPETKGKTFAEIQQALGAVNVEKEPMKC